MSTVCVSDDEACEKIRVSLEKCEVDEVIQTFVHTKGTGQEIPGKSLIYVTNNRSAKVSKLLSEGGT
jgi:hypothetical protein